MADIFVSSPSTPIALSQLAGQNIPYVIDVSGAAVSAWTPGSSINSPGLIRPTTCKQTGFVYQAQNTGQTGALEPAWPTVAGGTVIDGSVTWIAVAPPAGSEDSIASATWTQQAPPDGLLTISNQAMTSLTASAYLGQGTSGNIYTVNALITMHSGAIYRAAIFLSII